MRRIVSVAYRELLQVRVNCLICLGKLVESLDKWIIIDEVIPLLQSIPSREPAVLMAILGIIKVAMSSTKSGGLPREILATKVIPFLVPISIETSLNLNQVSVMISDDDHLMPHVDSSTPISLQSKICCKPWRSNNERSSSSFLSRPQSKVSHSRNVVCSFESISSAPIVPIGPSAADLQFDQKSSMVRVSHALIRHSSRCFFFEQIDQFMLGHGFNSEVAQNKTMAATFDTNQAADAFKPQQLSSNQSISSEHTLGKKVSSPRDHNLDTI